MTPTKRAEACLSQAEGHHLGLVELQPLVEEAREVHVHQLWRSIRNRGTRERKEVKEGGPEEKPRKPREGGHMKWSRIPAGGEALNSPLPGPLTSPVAVSTRMFSPCLSPRPTTWPTMLQTAALCVYTRRARNQAAGQGNWTGMRKKTGEKKRMKI